MAALLPEAADTLRGIVAAHPGAALLSALAAGYVAESRTGSDLVALARLLGEARSPRQ